MMKTLRRVAAPDAPPDTDTTTPAGSSVVELAGVAARVGNRTLWSGLDLTVGRGEFVAVLGPNGAGKSTLVRMLLGLTRPAAGAVRVLGRAPGRAGRNVGYLPQRRSFDGSARIRGVDLVRLGWDGHRWGVPLPGTGGDARQRVAEAIELVGASRYAHRLIGELSGGEQQRLLIAQALVSGPGLLLLDEPLDSLDLPNQHAIAALVSDICHTKGVSVLMVAHDVNPILPFLDGVLYLAPGGSACGPVSEVITTETLSKLYGTRVEVLRTSDDRLVVVGQPDAHDHHVGTHP
jgi:zinc/manganese transport system ATP-binding protein